MKRGRAKSYGQLKAEEQAAKKELDEAQAEADQMEREIHKTWALVAANGILSPHSLFVGVPQAIIEWISLHRAKRRVSAARRLLEQVQSNIQTKRAARKKNAVVGFGVVVAVGAGTAAVLRQIMAAVRRK